MQTVTKLLSKRNLTQLCLISACMHALSKITLGLATDPTGYCSCVAGQCLSVTHTLCSTKSNSAVEETTGDSR